MKKNLLPFVSFCILSVLLLNSCGAEINEKESKSFSSKSSNHKESLKFIPDKESNRKVNLNPELRDNTRSRLQNANYGGTIPQASTGKIPRNNLVKPINSISDPKLVNQTGTTATQQSLPASTENTSQNPQNPSTENDNIQKNPNQNFHPQINNRVFGISIGGIPKIKSPVSNQVINQNKKDQPINEQLELDAELQKELQNVLSEAVEKQKQIIAKYPKVKKQVDDKKLQIFVLCRYVS